MGRAPRAFIPSTLADKNSLNVMSQAVLKVPLVVSCHRNQRARGAVSCCFSSVVTVTPTLGLKGTVASGPLIIAKRLSSALGAVWYAI
jgi:hypothetical protein